MVKYFCDSCGKELSDRNGNVTVFVNHMSRIGYYCEPCVIDKKKWLLIQKAAIQRIKERRH